MDRQTDTNMARSLEHLMVLFEGLVGHGKVKRDVINNTKKGIKNVTQDIKENVLLHEIEEIEEQLHEQSYNPLDIMGNLEHLLEEMDNFVQIQQHRLRRSSEQWTCSDLAIIVREYDYVINLLERINTFIRDNILNKLDDQMDEEVKNFVTQTLAVYTDAEQQLKTKREPFVQYQSELRCDSTSSTEIVLPETLTTTRVSTSSPEETNTSDSEESTTVTTITINVGDITQKVETQKTEFVAILNNLNSSTFAQYDQLTNLLGFLDNLITSLNGISTTSIGGRRKRSIEDCSTHQESMEVMEGMLAVHLIFQGFVNSLGEGRKC